MHIAIEGHRGANLVVALHSADGHGDVVDHAESLAMIGKGVVKAAADADADFVDQGLARCEDRAARRQPESVGKIARVGNLHFHFFARAECAGLQLLHVVGLVDEKYVLVGRWLGFEKVGGVGDAGGDQAIANAAILFGREYVVADGEVIGVAVDEFEREHDEAIHHTQSCAESLSS